MAEVVVAPVVKKLVELLEEEAKLFKGVHKEVQSLKNELKSIKCFLKDAEARSARKDTESGVKVWVKQVMDEANRIEDVVDEYIRRVVPSIDNEGGFADSLKRIGGSIKRSKARFGIASEVKGIKKSLREIKERSERYNFRSISSEDREASEVDDQKCDSRLGSHYVEEEELVGIDFTRDYLISALVDGASGSRSVISLVGTGGIGKTTLASKVFNSEAVKSRFSCFVWITVSQSYNMAKIMKSMMKQLRIEANHVADEADTIKELCNVLREYLKTHRYLVVFDDLWDFDFWKIIKNALPRNDNGSKVIVTTRNGKIAMSACQETSFDIVHKLEPLEEEMALDLFCKKAFQSEPQNRCPEELYELARGIVAKCEGLPLLITAIASLLSTKDKIASEWKVVLDNMSSELESNPQLSSTLNILLLSYNDLPSHLKPCFLYFCIFPEDYSVSDLKLYLLWIAEGFVKPKRDKRLEDIAKEYLEDLIHRNLVQISYLECRGYDRMCKVHDLMREIILLMADDLSFCQILDQKNPRFRTNYRRLAIHGSEELNVRDIVEDSRVRSVFIFGSSELTKSFLATLFKKFKLLRVLDFANTRLRDLPKETGKLFHLKYLCLINTEVKTLPKSIGKLRNLQSLILTNTQVRELPFEIADLPSLRHFFNSYWDKAHNKGLNTLHGIRIPRGIGRLLDLQTLNNLEAYQGLDSISELEKLKRMRYLSVSKLTNETGQALCVAISKMSHLDHLVLSLIHEDHVLDLQHVSSPPCFLRYLFLRGPMQNLPRWISLLHNLLELKLHWSKLLEGQLIQPLQGLPNLSRLFLYKAYEGEGLYFEEGSFQKLKLLLLSNLSELKTVNIEKGAMPCLEMLSIGNCPLLKEVPLGVEHLTDLKALRLDDMPEEFQLGVIPDNGPDYWRVKHVTSISFRVTNDNGGFTALKLRPSDPYDICCAFHLRVM